MYIQKPIQNTVGICKQITVLIFYQVSPGLVTLLKYMFASEQVSNSFFILSVSPGLVSLLKFICDSV
jgi:hypothetical protein